MLTGFGGRSARFGRYRGGGGSASAGSLTQAEKTGSPCQAPGTGLAWWARGSSKAAATTAKGCAKRNVATRRRPGRDTLADMATLRPVTAAASKPTAL